MKKLCMLCQTNETIKASHIIPAFVFRGIKEASPTGFLRNPFSPNVRVQDGDKMPLLCESCEGRFSVAEGQFARRVFQPFSGSDQDTFDYGPWLHYFLTSLSWRTLALEIPTMGDANDKIRAAAQDALEKEKSYLLGDTTLATDITQHLFLFSGPHDVSDDLVEMSPNVLLRCSAFGYATWMNSCDCLAVIHNLAGIFCIRVILDHPKERWENTKIDPGSGRFTPPQKVKSWLFKVLIEGLQDTTRDHPGTISEAQKMKILEAAKKNPSASALRFHQADNDLRNKNGC